jgi:phosphoglycolate phosphatase
MDQVEESRADMLSDYPLLVFDWDGTLMDSAGQIVACLQAAARDVRVEVRSEPEIREIIGLGLSEAMQTLYPVLDRVSQDRLIDAYRDHYLDERRQTSRLFAGSEQVLRRLHESGFLLAVATGKSRRGLERVFDQTGLGEVFHASRCADETFSKPHPQMLQEIMVDLDTPATHTLMIGDTEFDMQMAGNAGTAAMAVSYGVHPAERLAAYAPVATLNDIRDLLSYL